MPPRTRAVRAPKASKENLGIVANTKAKTIGKGPITVRKPLADKTNSASDENASPEPFKKVIKKSSKASQKIMSVIDETERPRRNRRLPPRYVENKVLNNLSNSKDNTTTPIKSLISTPAKDLAKIVSPFTTPTNVLDNSLIASRPKRVSRLPSKFDENSVSPNKFVPTKCHTSTPLIPKEQSKPKHAKRPLGSNQKLDIKKNLQDNDVSPQITKKSTPKKVTPLKSTPDKRRSLRTTPNGLTCHASTPIASEVQNKPQGGKKILHNQKTSVQKSSDAIESQMQTIIPLKRTAKKVPQQKNNPVKISPQKHKNSRQRLVQQKLTDVVKNNANINEKQERVKRLRKPVQYKDDTLSPKSKSPENDKTKQDGRKLLQANSSFRVLEEKKSKKSDNQDIYEFTFDPSEEPTPQKKKRKKVVSKKVTKAKPRVYNNNYEKNIARALADLKNVVTKQKLDDEAIKKASKSVPTNIITAQPVTSKGVSTNVPSSVVISTVAEVHTDPGQNASVRSNISTRNHVSIRVEDIAADFDASMDHHDDINYSPVNSPDRIEVEPVNYPRNTSPGRNVTRPNDPLNLRTDLTFFDEPIASSSMNASSRNPMATPWRVEFENLPIKWQANTYVKPDMTPALECSFINNFDDSKKKHVYTNMVTETNDALPEIEENEAPKLKQTSIISFIKEVVERNSAKKKRGVSATPTKANSLFDVPTASASKTPRKETSGAANTNNSAEKEQNKPQKRKNDADNNPTPAKLPHKDNENTLFGFDDSENQDQENVSPVKIVNNNRLRSLRSHSGAVLKELNKQTGPMRAELPAAMKAKLAPSSEAVEKIYDQMKSAADAPVLLEANGPEVTNIAMPDCLEDDSQSVHLFEDIELVHHLKPSRKSYGKAKKVAFQHSDSASEGEAVRNQSSDDHDDLGDLSFHLPEVKAKKATKKKKGNKLALSKKEKAEVDAWAAGFNSMCEDIEEFDLVVE